MRRRVIGAGLVLALLTVALVMTTAGSAKPEQSPLKVAFIYPGPHNDGGWAQAHDRGRLLVEKTFGDKVQTTYKENVFSNAQVPQIVAGLVREGYTMIFGCSFGQFENGVNGQLYAKYPEVLFEQATGLQIKKNQSEYFGAGEDTIYLSGMAAGAASKKGLIGYVVPFGIPEVVRHINAFTLGAQATHPGARVKLDLDERVVLSAEGDGGRAEPHRRGRRRDRAERRQPGRRGRGRVEGRAVGRVRLQRAEVGAEAVAHGGDVQLGPVLREARPGSHERHVEVGLLLRHDQGRVHRDRSVRLEGVREDEGADRGEEEGDRLGQVQRLPGPDLRPVGKAQGQAGPEAQAHPGPVHDAVAREGRRRQGLVGPSSGLARGGARPRQ